MLANSISDYVAESRNLCEATPTQIRRSPTQDATLNTTTISRNKKNLLEIETSPGETATSQGEAPMRRDEPMTRTCATHWIGGQEPLRS